MVFFAITFLTLFSGWRFIHSEKFSRVASLKVSKILTEKAGAKLSFSGVNFSLFPLSTTFKNVKITKNDPSLLDIDLEAKELQVAFTYASFLASEPEIDEVNLRDGKVNLKIFKKSEKDINLKRLKTREVFSKYIEILTQIPVRLNFLTLEKIQLNIDQTSLLVNKASLSPNRLKVRVKADVSNVVVAHENPDLGPLELSNIQLLFSADKDEWRVDNLKIYKDKNLISLRAVAFNEGNLLYLNSNGSMNLNVEDILSILKTLPKDIAAIKGHVEGKFSTSGIIDNPDLTTNFVGRRVDTEWIKLDVLTATINKKKNLIIAQKLSAATGNESYLLKKPQAFYDLRAKAFTDFIFSLNLQNAQTGTFLYSIKDSLSVLKGQLTGDVEARLLSDRAVFSIKDNMVVKNFKLTSKNEKDNILINSGFNLNNTTITINEDFSVDLDLKASMPNTSINAKGRITDKFIDIETKDSKIDMTVFGPIAGIKINGSGPSYVKVSGPTDDVKFDFIVDWNNFSLVDLNFGRVKADFSLGLKNLVLSLNSLNGVYNKSNYTASGLLGFEGKSKGMDLKIDFQNTNFSDARKMLHLVFKNIKLPVDPQFNFEANYAIKGGYDLDSLRVDGQIRGTELKVAGEEAEKISLNFTLANSQLNLKQIKRHDT